MTEIEKALSLAHRTQLELIVQNGLDHNYGAASTVQTILESDAIAALIKREREDERHMCAVTVLSFLNHNNRGRRRRGEHLADRMCEVIAAAIRRRRKP
ncbi:MAG: hypothetical protein L0Y56_03930 [Nitrospira sp.]|nr:hypothetical protein [Nitrospira sp.]